MTLRYNIQFSQPAREQLRALPKTVRRRIGVAITRMQTDLLGDVKKLSARQNAYRLRVGTYRILFYLEGTIIDVYAVKDRKNAYD